MKIISRRKKNKIKLIAHTEIGKKAMMTQKKTNSPMEKAVHKLFGIKEEIICEEPYTVVSTFRNVPETIFQQIIIGIYSSLEELGAKQDVDYKLEVE